MADLLSGMGSSAGAGGLGLGLMDYISAIQANKNARAQNATTDKWGPLLALYTHGGGTPQVKVPKASFANIMEPYLANTMNVGANLRSQIPTKTIGDPSQFNNVGDMMGGDQAEGAALAPNMMMAAGGGFIPKYLSGGSIPGRAQVPGNSPLNDTKMIQGSPGEVILPRTVAKAGMNGAPWKVAAYLQAVKKHGPGPMPVKQNYANKQDQPMSGSMSPWQAMAGGGKLDAASRNALPSSDFALPGRRYPINDRSHAANAKARVSQFGSPAEKAKVNAAVARKYPGMGGSK